MNSAILSRPVRHLVIIVACLSLAGAIVAGLYGERLAGVVSSEVDSYSAGPLGHRALVELLQAQGTRVDRIRSAAIEDPALPLLFLAPELEAYTPRGKLTLAQVLARRTAERLATVVAIPKWDLWRDDRGVIAIRKPSSQINGFLDAALPGTWLRPHLSLSSPPEGFLNAMPGRGALDGVALALQAPQTVSLPPGAGHVVLGTREHALIARLPDADGPIFLVADPDVFHNFNIHRGENGAVLPLLVFAKMAPGHVLVDEVFHGHARQVSLWTALGEFPQVLIVWHGLVLGAAALAMGRSRFGTPMVMRPRRGRGPREVLAVTATLLAHGQPAPRLAARYLDALLADLAGRLRIKGERKLDDLARRLDGVAGRRGLAPCLAHIRERLLAGGEVSEKEALRLAGAARRRHGALLVRNI